MAELIITTPEKLQETISRAMSRTIERHIPDIIREATSKPWMTKQELMDLTGWSSRTIQNLRDTNQIPYSQHRHKIIYPRKGIMEFLENHHIKPQE